MPFLLDDEKLVKETLKGKTSAFAKLISRNENRIRSLGMSFFHNSTDTEDFIQEVFLKAYKNLSSFKGKSKFSTWLTSIAYTTALNSVTRKKEADSIPEQMELVSNYDTPEDAQIKKATVEAIRDAVKDLPENYKLCVDMFFFGDLSLEEISQVTSIPVNTIKSHLFRAKKILREKLKELL